jgi:hypothetical protein
LKVIEGLPDDPANVSVSSVNGDHSHGDENGNDDGRGNGGGGGGDDGSEADDTRGRVSHVYLPSRRGAPFLTSLILFTYVSVIS